MNTASPLPLAFWLLMSLTASVAAADELLYFPATVANTTLADGTALKVVAKPGDSPAEITRGPGDAEPNNHWHWREGAGSGTGTTRGVFAAAGTQGNNAPMLRTLAVGLQPNANYQAFGFFWVAGFASADAEPTGDTQWDIRLGCGIAKMMGYGHRDNAGLPGTIGRRAGGDGTIRQMDSPLRPAQRELLDRDGDKCLFRAPLGTMRTDAMGTLVVYVDDQAEDANQGRTWYDGIGVIAAASKAEVGSGTPGALHLAVRCGDWEMVRRELEAGANINALDHDGLTPLFYVCADLDSNHVADFLKAGAAPDVKGQTLTPLWAAATSGDVKLTQLLLDAGAKVPTKLLPESDLQGLLKNSLSYEPLRKLVASSLAHPAVAAIISGSVKGLKLLIKKEPQLDFDTLFKSAVECAIDNGHPEMAEFLIDRGCGLDGNDYSWQLPKFAEADSGSAKISNARILLVKSIMAPVPMRGVVAALARRGVSMVDTTPLMPSPFVLPWDALTAAAMAGDSELITSLLPAATNVSLAYKVHLIVLAETGGNAQVLSMIRKQFGDVKMPRWSGRALDGETAQSTDAPRVFQPRSVPAKPRTMVTGKRVLAVIASPESAGPAAAIAAKASVAEGWVVVEREQIDTLLQERDLPKPWEKNVQQLSTLGDRLSADLLILVSQLKSEQLSLLRLEAVDVKTGLLIDRLHLDIKEFKPDEFCNNYLADIRRKLEDHLAGGMLTAITILPITADAALSSSASIEGVLHAGLMQEIDQTRGMIALTREQMQPLAEEKTFQQTGGLWGAAWTVEGSLHPLQGERVELSLRVRSLGKDAASHDVKSAGSAADIQALVKGAWQQIVAAIHGDKRDPQGAIHDAPEQRASAEAARLLREAEWLHNINRGRDAAPLIDAATYLGADPVKAVLLRMDIRMNLRQFKDPSQMFYDGYAACGFPLNPAVADLAARNLDEHLELLRLNAESLTKIESSIQDPTTAASVKDMLARGVWRALYGMFWENLHAFLLYRSYLQPQRMDTAELATLKSYDQELAQYLKRMFARISPNDDSTVPIPQCHRFTALQFRAVPTLGPVVADSLIRNSNKRPIRLFYYDVFGSPTSDGKNGPSRTGIMCGFLEKAMAGMEVPDHELRQAEIAFLRSTDEQRAIAARQLLRIRISMATRQPQPYQEWVPLNLLSRWVPMISGESDYDYFTPPHGEIFIPSLIQSPAAVPDMIFRHGIYQTFRNVLFAATHSTNFSYFPPRKNLDYAIDEKLKWIVSAGLGAPALDDVLAGVGLLDRTYGVTLGADFEPKIAKLRPQGQPGSFGSKGQFPILNYEGTVDTKLLIDVRNGVTDQPAMITHAMIDPTNHHILWLALQPYQDLDFRLQEPCPSCGSGYTIPPFEVAQPWLVAIDCRDGSTLRKINLATIPGLWSQAPPTTMYLEEFGQSFLTGIFANDTHLLVQIFWGRPSGTPVQQRSSMNALVSINRLTGEVNKHLVDTCLLNTQLVATNGSDQPAVVGIGTSFFVAEKWDAPILSQLIPGRVPKLLTQSGRRPEESPFDREDRKIALLRNDHGRLLVASSWEHFAYYDPAKQHWDDAPKRSAAEWRSYVLEIDRNAYWARYAHYQFKPANGDADACQFDYRDEATQPARLKFQIGDGPMSYLPVRMSIPDSYRARFQVASDGGVALKNPADRKYEWINIADMARSSMAIPAILNQTENHLVLATRVTSGIHVSATEPTYLPFLWIMNKSEAQAAMNRAQAK